MYRLKKNDDRDIGLAVGGLGKAITWEEFQAWLDHVVLVTDVDDLPGYIFDLLGCKSPADMWEPKPDGVFGFMVYPDLDYAVYWGVGYARKQLGFPLIRADDDYIVSREESAAALARHPDVLEWYERFFEAIGKPGELSRGG